MKAMMISALAGALLASTAAQAQLKPEEQVEIRQAGYQFMAWNMGKIKAQVIDGKEPYDQAKVAAAANAIAAIANSGMGALYLPGTDKGKGWEETRAKSNIWTDKEKMGKVATDFVREANEMAKVAAGGDAAAVGNQLGKLSGTCKGCHDDFKAKR